MVRTTVAVFVVSDPQADPSKAEERSSDQKARPRRRKHAEQDNSSTTPESPSCRAAKGSHVTINCGTGFRALYSPRLLTTVSGAATNSGSRIHGPDHWWQVHQNGAALSAVTDGADAHVAGRCTAVRPAIPNERPVTRDTGLARVRDRGSCSSRNGSLTTRPFRATSRHLRIWLCRLGGIQSSLIVAVTVSNRSRA
jgi:hypothetical protein